MHSPETPGPEQVSAAASPFSQPKQPSMSSKLVHEAYGFRTDVIGWLQDAWELGKRSFTSQFILMLSLGCAVTFVAALVGLVFGGGSVVLGYDSTAGFAVAMTGVVSASTIMAFGYMLAWSGSFLALEDAARDNQAAVGEYFRNTIAMAPRILRMGLLIGVLTTAAYLVCGGLAVAGIMLLGEVAGALLTFVALMALMVGVWVAWPVLSVASVSLVVEETTVRKALSLGFARVRPLLGKVLLGSIVMYMVMFGVSLLILPALFIPFLGNLVQMAFTLAIMPFTNAWLFVVYGNARDHAEAS